MQHSVLPSQIYIYIFFNSEKERRKEGGKEGKRKRRNEKIKGVMEEESRNDGTEFNGLISTSVRESHVVYLKEREKCMVKLIIKFELCALVTSSTSSLRMDKVSRRCKSRQEKHCLTWIYNFLLMVTPRKLFLSLHWFVSIY